MPDVNGSILEKAKHLAGINRSSNYVRRDEGSLLQLEPFQTVLQDVLQVEEVVLQFFCSALDLMELLDFSLSLVDSLKELFLNFTCLFSSVTFV
jgi:hypothetical protein